MQRLHLIQRLKHFGMSKNILEMVYKNLVESIMSFKMTLRYGILKAKQKWLLMKLAQL